MTTVWVVDQNRDRVAQLGQIEELDLIQRSGAPGGGVLTTWTDAPSARMLTTLVNPGIEITDRYGVTSFEGWVVAWDADISDADTGRVNIDLVDLKDVLEGVDLRPEPGTVTPPFSTSSHYNQTGTVTEIVAGLVEAHCGQSAPVERRHVTVDTVTPAGPTINLATRFRKTLAEQVAALCDEYELVSKVYFDEVTGLRFAVETAPVRTVQVGPERGNVEAYRFGWQRPEATDVICGGQGELTARTFATATAAYPLWPLRRETFIEHTEIDNAPDLADAADEHLVSVAGGFWTEVDVAQVETVAGVRFGVDLQLGDKVPFLLDETETVLQITELTTTIDADQISRAVTIGVPATRGTAIALMEARRADRHARQLGGQ